MDLKTGTDLKTGSIERWTSTLVGGVLMTYGARRRSALGAALALGGAALMVRGATGRSLGLAALGRNMAGGGPHEEPPVPSRGGEPDPTLAVRGDRLEQEDKDLVEQASEESFPASDPPSFSPTTIGRPT